MAWWEYEERENPEGDIAGSVIPAAFMEEEPQEAKFEEIEKPAVMSTDSESEQDLLDSKVKREDRKIFKWTPFYEEVLEELLVKHIFDFKLASEELNKMVNDPE